MTDDAYDLPPNPFVGLRPFESTEGLLFFGRDEQTTELMQKLDRGRFLAVVGSSGCGKSSLIRAGLIPKLKGGFLVASRDRWVSATMKPGKGPMQNFADALLAACGDSRTPGRIAALSRGIRRGGAHAVVRYLSKRLDPRDTNVLLLVDQFEEIFRFGFHSDEGDEAAAGAAPDRWKWRRDEATDFVSVMLELARQESLPVYVVITMRSDFIGDCDSFYELPQAMNGGQYLVPRLTRRQRMEAIECPIRLYGEEISPGLLDRVLNDMGMGLERSTKDVSEESDQLPVMQHALMRTWENWLTEETAREEREREAREGRPEGQQEPPAASELDEPLREPIDLRHYEAVGTVNGALSKDADKALAGLNEDEQRIARLMFQALTDTDAKGRRLRRPARLKELGEITGADTATIKKVINHFRDDNRLFLIESEDRLGGDDPLVDISHESLIRRWAKLSAWVDAEAEARDQYLRLAGEAARYFDPQHRRAGLLRDPALQLALDWWDERGPTAEWARRYDPHFAHTEEFLFKSREERETEAKTAEDARLHDLRQAQQLAGQRRRTNVILAVATILLAVSLFATVVAWQRAVASEAQAQASEAQAQASESRVKAAYGELEAQNVELAGKKLLVEVQKQELNKSYAKLNTAAETLRETNIRLEAEKKNAVAAQQQAENDRNDALRAKGTAVLAQVAGTDYRKAVKSQRESRLDEALGEFQDALGKYETLKDERAQADTHAELGKMLSKMEPIPEVEPSDGTGVKPPEAGDLSNDIFTASDITNAFLLVVHGRGSESAKVDDMPKLTAAHLISIYGFDKNERLGLKHYGQAVAKYQKVGDSNGSASLLEEVAELANPMSGDGELRYPKNESVWKDIKGTGRARVSIALLCEASETFESKGNTDRRVATLFKLAGRVAALPPKSDDPFFEQYDAIHGCPNLGDDPSAYYEEAMKVREKAIDGAGQDPKTINARREAAVATALDFASHYRTDGAEADAEKYYRRAVNVYKDYEADASQRKARASLLVSIGKGYFGDTELLKPDPEKGEKYYAEAEALYSGAADREGKEALADVLISIETIPRLERAAQIYESLNNLEAAGKTYDTIGYKMNLAMKEASDAHLKAARSFEIARLAAQSSEKARLAEEEAMSLISAAFSLRVQGQRAQGDPALKLFEDSLEAYKKALTLLPATEANRSVRANPLINIGDLNMLLKRPGEALDAYTEAAPLLDQGLKSTRFMRANLFYSKGEAARLKGDAGAATNAFEESLRLSKEVDYSEGIRRAEAALNRQTAPEPTPTPTPSDDSSARNPGRQVTALPAYANLDADLTPPLPRDAVGDPELVDRRTDGSVLSAQQPSVAVGDLDYKVENGNSKLIVTVEKTGLKGEELTVTIGDWRGTIIIGESGDGELNLRTRRGEQVPSVAVGMTVTVTDKSGRVIVSGVVVDKTKPRTKR
jgi:energy-coupling factor transporter ATP-binding protein EcfA2